ncbi:hypothetical protein B0H10DRAFT_1948892 [Mycena sp. CBHHK59/15]|nr:hypothetical protein B0H10DRAFT_1948892 [Mycena sp. CBHHK59/15]
MEEAGQAAEESEQTGEKAGGEKAERGRTRAGREADPMRGTGDGVRIGGGRDMDNMDGYSDGDGMRQSETRGRRRANTVVEAEKEEGAGMDDHSKAVGRRKQGMMADTRVQGYRNRGRKRGAEAGKGDIDGWVRNGREMQAKKSVDVGGWGRDPKRGGQIDGSGGQTEDRVEGREVQWQGRGMGRRDEAADAGSTVANSPHKPLTPQRMQQHDILLEPLNAHTHWQCLVRIYAFPLRPPGGPPAALLAPHARRAPKQAREVLTGGLERRTHTQRAEVPRERGERVALVPREDRELRRAQRPWRGQRAELLAVARDVTKTYKSLAEHVGGGVRCGVRGGGWETEVVGGAVGVVGEGDAGERGAAGEAGDEEEPEAVFVGEELAEALEELAVLDGGGRRVAGEAVLVERDEGVAGLHPQVHPGVARLARIRVQQQQMQVPPPQAVGGNRRLAGDAADDDEHSLLALKVGFPIIVPHVFAEQRLESRVDALCLAGGIRGAVETFRKKRHFEEKKIYQISWIMAWP